MGNIFNEDFQDFIRAFNENDVEYLLVGGYSVILYGHARTTGDMDIWVNRTKKNYQKIEAAFKQFGLPIFDMTESNFLNHPSWDVFRFGRVPVAIDIMIKVKGMDFNSCYLASTIHAIDDLNIRVISYQDLLSAKRASSRNKDIGDIDALENNTTDN
jgi:hypothetical protein